VLGGDTTTLEPFLFRTNPSPTFGKGSATRIRMSRPGADHQDVQGVLAASFRIATSAL